MFLTMPNAKKISSGKGIKLGSVEIKPGGIMPIFEEQCASKICCLSGDRGQRSVQEQEHRGY